MMKNKTLGSMLMVAGTTIGAGMLAMPLTSAEIGFTYTVVLLFGLWVLLAFSGLLFMEVYQTAVKKDVGIATLAEQYFGIAGRIITTLTLLILLYALSAAYISGGGSLLFDLLPIIGDENLTLKIAIVLFTVVLGAFVIIGIKSVDGLNRLLFSVKIVVFLLVLVMMLSKVSIDNLMAMPLKYAFVVSAVPIFFTSFGFHVIMASINDYLDGDVRRLRIAIIGGTAIPLVAYLLWQLATHGVLSQFEFIQILQNDPTLNGLVKATLQITGSQLLSSSVRLFSALALITSFLGVALGLFECIGDLLKRVKMPANRLTLAPLTFLPPLIFALFYPNAFIAALGYAGQLFAFYGLILPVGLAWQARKAHPNLPYRVAGGQLSLIVAALLGVIIMIIPFLVQSGYLPQVSG